MHITAYYLPDRIKGGDVKCAVCLSVCVFVPEKLLNGFGCSLPVATGTKVCLRHYISHFGSDIPKGLQMLNPKREGGWD